MDESTKQCRCCGVEKPLSGFASHPNTKDRRSNTCRECDRTRHIARRAKNVERHQNGPSVNEKKCPRCKMVKAAVEFPLNPTTATGLGSYCLGCSREYGKIRYANPATRAKSAEDQRKARGLNPERFFGYRLKKDYTISASDYQNMLESQGGVCAICGGVNADGTRLHVDHDHSCCPGRKKSCGKCVRGLLCSNCNTALGLFADSATRLASAIGYLESR